MSAKYAFNGSVAKLQHEMWKNKLITFLNGGPAPNAITHRECSLGKWIYEEGGKEEYGSMPEMHRLEREHTKFHDAIKKVIEEQQAGRDKDAWSSYEAIKPLSSELLSVIDIFTARLKKEA
jgi:hypothetical protein